MCQLWGHVHPTVAAGRDGTLPVQRLWPLPQDERHQPAPHQTPAPPGKQGLVPRGQGGGRCHMARAGAAGFSASLSSRLRAQPQWAAPGFKSGVSNYLSKKVQVEGLGGWQRVISSTFSVSLNCEDGPAHSVQPLNYAEVKSEAVPCLHCVVCLLCSRQPCEEG